MEEPLNIADQFDNFLTRVGLDKNRMPANQWDELRNAFFAGSSVMLMLFRNEIPALPEDQAIIAMDKLWNEAETFWRNILKQHEG